MPSATLTEVPPRRISASISGFEKQTAHGDPIVLEFARIEALATKGRLEDMD